MNAARQTHDVCPWWQAYFFDNPLRRLFHSPRKLFADYLSEGMTAVDIGCGMGFFSISMAKIVNELGKILAIDIQPQMLTVLRRRAERAGVSQIIDTHQSSRERIIPPVRADFVLLFWAMHEIPDTDFLSREISEILNPGGFCFIAEPAFHVNVPDFVSQIRIIEKEGLKEVARPQVAFSRATVLIKPTDLK